MKTVESSMPVSAHAGRGKTLVLLASVFTVVCAVIYFASKGQIVLLLAGGVALAASYGLFRSPELATLVFAFVLYTNMPVVGVQVHGVPTIVAAASSLLLVLPLANYLIRRRERLFADRAFLLILVYFVAFIAAALFAKDMTIAFNEIGNFLLEGLVLYYLLINVIRELPTLKRTIWTLLLAGGFLGGLSLFQEMTRTYDNSYGGFAQKNEDLDMDQVNFEEYGGSRRAGGPFGKENRYAQIMVVIFPLALCMFYIAPSRKLKFLALAAAGLILGGIVLTFSRGAFVTLAAMMVIIVFLRYVRPVQALGGAALLVLAIIVALPEYVERVSTVGNLSNLASRGDGAIEADGSLRGRFAQNIAAIVVFLEHPILGVGPGQFAKFYSKKYGNEVGTKRLISNRRAHNLYLEIAADMGIIGLTAFMMIPLFIVRQLWQLRRRLRTIRPDLAHLATAILLGIFGYFGTATFLQLSYQRYYWFLIALAGAAIRILGVELAASSPPKNHLLKDERVAEGENIPHK
jgi:O-antigen ligase